MITVISLLRGVNVGGHNKIAMDALRSLYASLRLSDPQTYVQSGNVVFRTEERDMDKLRNRIESAIERKFGFRPAVILRTEAELRDAIGRNPFASRTGIDPGKLIVMFLAAEPGAEGREKVLGIQADPEELRMDGREIFVYFPNGAGQSKLPWQNFDKMLKVAATGRNWNTVTRLLQMAEKSGG